LEAFGVPEGVMALALGELPHPLFTWLCLPPNDLCFPAGQITEDRWGEEPRLIGLPLWEHGSVYEVGVYGVSVRRTRRRLEYWNYDICGEAETPPDALIATSEQGLFFWLFWDIVERENQAGDAWREPVRVAAELIGFRYAEEAMAFHADWSRGWNAGNQDFHHRLLRKRCLRL
jgi:hypothetical protein